MSAPQYTRVPQEETIEMKDASGRVPMAKAEEAPPSQLKVTAVVVFYLVAAIVVRNARIKTTAELISSVDAIAEWCCR